MALHPIYAGVYSCNRVVSDLIANVIVPSLPVIWWSQLTVVDNWMPNILGRRRPSCGTRCHPVAYLGGGGHRAMVPFGKAFFYTWSRRARYDPLRYLAAVSSVCRTCLVGTMNRGT